jgi:secondary thiamine-phosphate synthase enzyme
MRMLIRLETHHREELVDITERVRAAVRETGIQDGLAALYAQGATTALMIQENWDASVPMDVVDCLQRLVPRGVWRHDEQDGNGDAHIKAGLVGPSETLPLVDGALGLSTWQSAGRVEAVAPGGRDERVEGERDGRNLDNAVPPLAPPQPESHRNPGAE